MPRRLLSAAAACTLLLGLAACGEGVDGPVTTPPPSIDISGPSDWGGDDGAASDGGGDDTSPSAAPEVPAPDPADYPDDLSINDALARIVVDVINGNMPELGWQDQKSIIVKVEKDDAGYYGLSSDAISQLDQDMIAY